MRSFGGRLGLVCWMIFVLVNARASAQPGPGVAVYLITHFDVLGADGGVEKANKLLLDFAAASRKDKGCTRFEVLVQDGRPNHTAIFEVWQSRAAFEAHLAANYAKEFREKIQPLLGSPFDERLHTLLK
jgi:quinol monooxygenase YgiN